MNKVEEVEEVEEVQEVENPNPKPKPQTQDPKPQTPNTAQRSYKRLRRPCGRLSTIVPRVQKLETNRTTKVRFR